MGRILISECKIGVLDLLFLPPIGLRTHSVVQVDVIERCGGQMTNDGKRRRTPGGVMWNILRGRVQPAVYKEIMSQGNEVQVLLHSFISDT